MIDGCKFAKSMEYFNDIDKCQLYTIHATNSGIYHLRKKQKNDIRMKI
jgi:hypothetical protein